MTKHIFPPLFAISTIALSSCGSPPDNCANSDAQNCAMVEISGDPKQVDINGTATYNADKESYKTITNNNSYEIVRDALKDDQKKRYDRGRPTAEINGETYYVSVARGNLSDFAGFGGVNDNSVFLGQGGTLHKPSITSGKVTYTGYSYVASANYDNKQDFQIKVDFDKDTMTGSDSEGAFILSDGVLNGNVITGDASYKNANGFYGDGKFQAGFYAGEELNGTATDSENFVAVFTTTKQ